MGLCQDSASVRNPSSEEKQSRRNGRFRANHKSQFSVPSLHHSLLLPDIQAFNSLISSILHEVIEEKLEEEREKERWRGGEGCRRKLLEMKAKVYFRFYV